MGGVFKAYDVRGVYPTEIDEKLAYAIGFHFRGILSADDLARGETVVVSHDMRSSSPALVAALCDGLRTSGLGVVAIGLATTPMNYFAIGHLRTAAGIQVTASHNPARYNGFKFSRRDAIPVSAESGIQELETMVRSGALPPPAPNAPLASRDIAAAYREHVLSFVREREPRLKVAIDVANGMATLYEPLFGELGIEVVPLYFGLDGTFPNHEANPLKPENMRDLQRAVRDHGCAFGAAFDGDADRVLFVDDECELVGADLVTALFAAPFLARYPGAPIVFDVRSSWATEEAIRAAGGVPVKERVGHSFMKATMRRIDSPFGGELAGHFYYRANYTADSSLITLIEMLNVLRAERRPLSVLLKPFRRYFGTGEVNFHVDDKAAVIARIEHDFADATISHIDGVSVEYPDWWCNVRPSNTEPYLRLVLEARTPAALAAAQAKLLAILGRPETEAH